MRNTYYPVLSATLTLKTRSAHIFATERKNLMKKSVIILLIACALMLSACTRDTTVLPSASPSMQPTNTPDMPPVQPDTSEQPAMGDGPLMDGDYSAEVSEAYVASSGHGWKEYLKITVKDQQIASLEYDALKDGKKKSEVTAEEYPMTPPPSEWTPQINDALRAASVPEAMDTVTGATMSSNVARQLYTAVLRAAREGKTETVIVDIT